MRYVPILIVMLVIVTGGIIAIPIMLACGWRPNIDDEKKAFKRAPGAFYKILFATPFILFGFALWAMGVNEKTATIVTFCLYFLTISVICFWSYKKSRGKIKKLENGLLKEIKEARQKTSKNNK